MLTLTKLLRREIQLKSWKSNKDSKESKNAQNVWSENTQTRVANKTGSNWNKVISTRQVEGSQEKQSKYKPKLNRKRQD